MRMVLCLRCEQEVRKDTKLIRKGNAKRDRCGICQRKSLCVAWDMEADGSQTA